MSTVNKLSFRATNTISLGGLSMAGFMALPTAGVYTVGQLVSWYETGANGQNHVYRFSSATQTQATPAQVLPDDWHVTTNPRIWELVSSTKLSHVLSNYADIATACSEGDTYNQAPGSTVTLTTGQVYRLVSGASNVSGNYVELLPAASTTQGGVVRVATRSEALAGSSESLALAPKNHREALLDRRAWYLPGFGWNSNSASGGNRGSYVTHSYLRATTTSGSWILLDITDGNSGSGAIQIGNGVSSMNWTIPGSISFALATEANAPLNSATGIIRCSLGRDCRANLTSFVADVTTMSAQTFAGFQVEGTSGQIYLVASNATTVQRVIATGYTLDANLRVYTVRWNGSGGISLWRDGTQIASLTGGPSAAYVNTAASGIVIEVGNGGTAAAYGATFGGVGISQENSA